jgi:hypothetical protein
MNKRTENFNDLQKHYQWGYENQDKDQGLYPPTKEAFDAASKVIQLMPDTCLDYELAISHNGEINFFLGSQSTFENNPLQVWFDQNGLISYYGKLDDQEIEGSDVLPEALPYGQFEDFVKRYP